MHFLYPTILAALAPIVVAGTTSSKRGLIYITGGSTAEDDLWDSSTSDLTWYYNYDASPTSQYDDKLEFVPMLWGVPDNPTTNMTFYDTVADLIESGMNITHVLGFNEPDGCDSGGSCVEPLFAAQVWKKQMEPLKAKYGVKLGGPACTGANTGFTWLQEFFTECSAIANSSCEVDFLPAHYYGDFQGLASHIGQLNSTYENISAIWMTEFACDECTLVDAQTLYNESTNWFDNSLSYLQRYSYFGAFESTVSNIGPNAAFLTGKGKLTDIGSWYLGGDATNNVPNSSASTVARFAGWGVVVCASVFLSFF